VRDEHYTPFKGPPQPEPPRREAVTVFVMARLRGDRTDSMRGSLRASPYGWESLYTLNGELDRSQWFAGEALARADLATHQDALAAAGWTPVPFHPSQPTADYEGGWMGGSGGGEFMIDTATLVLVMLAFALLGGI
jgi:hypothetical protein